MRKINPNKNEKLKKTRGATFQEVAENGKLLATRENPSYPGQFLMIYSYGGYAWVVVAGGNPERFITYINRENLKRSLEYETKKRRYCG
jgi:hypothetical protein